jgi:hypothetical protein
VLDGGAGRLNPTEPPLDVRHLQRKTMPTPLDLLRDRFAWTVSAAFAPYLLLSSYLALWWGETLAAWRLVELAHGARCRRRQARRPARLRTRRVGLAPRDATVAAAVAGRPPDAPQRRAARHGRCVLADLRAARNSEGVFLGRRMGPMDDGAHRQADHLPRVASALILSGQQQLFDASCIADVDLALMLMRLVSHGDPVPPHLAAHARHQGQAPGVQARVGIERPAGQSAAAAGAR